MLKTRLTVLGLVAASLILPTRLITVVSAQSKSAQTKGQDNTQSSQPNNKQPQGQSNGSSTGIEAFTLAYNGLRGDSIKIADRVGLFFAQTPKSIPHIIVLEQSTLDDLLGLEVANAEIDILNRQVCQYNPESGPGGGSGSGSTSASGGGGTGIVSEISSVVSATASLVQALTPDATSSDSDITIDNSLLVSETIGAIHRKNQNYVVFWPKKYLSTSEFDPSAAPPVGTGCGNAPPQDFLDAYRRLMAAYSNAQVWVTSSQLTSDQKNALKAILSRVERLRNDMEASTTKTVTNSSNQQPVSGQTRNNGQAINANGVDPTSDIASQQNSTAPLLKYVRVQSFLSNTLEPCWSPKGGNCHLLCLRMGAASGGSIIKKSFFHPTYFYYSGGAVSSYALINFVTGAVESSGTVTTVTNYMREKTFKKEYGTERRYDSKRDKEMDNKYDGDDGY